MILYREEWVELEEFAKRQTRIYPDACDTGVRIDNGKNQDVREATRRIIKKMTRLLKARIPSNNGNSVEWRFWIPVEMDEGIAVGCQIRVCWHKDPRRNVEFLSFNFQNGVPEL